MDQWKRGRAPELLYQAPRGGKADSFRNHTKPQTVGEVVTRITLLSIYTGIFGDETKDHFLRQAVRGMP